jgi:RNA polymerase sigma-70 factor (ECF subfamily)
MEVAVGPASNASVDMAPVLAAAARGDERAWRCVVDAYAKRVFTLARSRFGSAEAAEEITQSVFVTIATKIRAGEYDDQGKFEPWLFRVAMNRIRDEARRAKRQAAPTEPEAMAGLAGRAADDGDAEALGRLRRAMERLTESDREIIELRHHAGMSFKEMADLLAEPMGTLLARHHRALRKLKEFMEERLRSTEA